MSLLSGVKDLALAKALAAFLKPKLERYGELLELKLNTAAKSLSAEIKLRGDPAPLVISHVSYRLERNGEQPEIIFHDARVSKEWAQNLMDDHFPEIRVPVPPFVVGLLE